MCRRPPAAGPRRRLRLVKDTDICLHRKHNSMDPRLRDLFAAAAAFVIFMVLIFALPSVMGPGIGYLLALLGFLLAMGAAGYYTIEKLK